LPSSRSEPVGLNDLQKLAFGIDIFDVIFAKKWFNYPKNEGFFKKAAAYRLRVKIIPAGFI
jgi:hypothetical protein